MPQPLRLLAIEDSEADAELECIELRRSGFEVQLTRVDSLDALVQALRQGGWDLILCDHNLPGFSSKEALATAREEDPEVPFVILSGTIGEEAAVDALKSGARDVVVKTNLSRLGTVADREVREAAARRRHREVEIELQHSHARRQAILDAALDAVLAVDERGRVVDANPAAAAMFGAPASVLCKLPVTDLLPIDDILQAGPREAIASDRYGLRVERTAMRVDREPFPAELSLAQTALSNRPFWSVTVRDLTEQKQVEAENQALQAQLRQAQKMEAMGRLAAGITHDFNNIINIVSGYSELALKHAGDEPRLKSWLESIHDAGTHAHGLTRQLLAFSRQQVLEPTELDLNQELADRQSMLKMLLRHDTILELDLAPELWQIRADAQQLGQVLLNLVVNAVDAMPDGGLITIRTENREVTEHSHAFGYGQHIPTGRHVLLSIRDSGIGMDESVQEHIFDPFFTTKEAGKGTGLGLSTVFGIVSQSGGGVHVESEPGTGTTFDIYLPAASA